MANPDLGSTRIPAASTPAERKPDEGVVAESSRKELKNALYARCATYPADTLFYQKDLLSFGIIPNNELGQLLSCARQLTQEGLLKLLKKDDVVCWRVVKKEDAAKYDSYSFVLFGKLARFVNHKI